MRAPAGGQHRVKMRMAQGLDAAGEMAASASLAVAYYCCGGWRKARTGR
jgi:hypothetical protein